MVTVFDRRDKKSRRVGIQHDTKASPKTIWEIEAWRMANHILFRLLLGLPVFLPFKSINKPFPGLYS
jgi:hypothetical protein